MYICRMDILHMGSNMPCNGVPRENRWSATFNTSRIIYSGYHGEYGWYRAAYDNKAELRIKRLHNWGKS